MREKDALSLNAPFAKAATRLLRALPIQVSNSAAPSAIEAAIALSWSNGQTEGQICKLKLVKPAVCPRKHHLLQARVIGLA